MFELPARRSAVREVAQGGHDLRAGGGADGGAVLVEGDVADPVQLVLDAPVPADPAGEQDRVGLPAGQAGDRVDRRGVPPAGVRPAPTDELDRLGGVREELAGFEAGIGRRDTTLMVRVSTRPWPRARNRAADPIRRQGRARSRWSRRGWLAFTVIR
jgi:hypothetical protein